MKRLIDGTKVLIDPEFSARFIHAAELKKYLKRKDNKDVPKPSIPATIITKYELGAYLEIDKTKSDNSNVEKYGSTLYVYSQCITFPQ